MESDIAERVLEMSPYSVVILIAASVGAAA
jgi:hypothetical protein